MIGHLLPASWYICSDHLVDLTHRPIVQNRLPICKMCAHRPMVAHLADASISIMLDHLPMGQGNYRPMGLHNQPMGLDNRQMGLHIWLIDGGILNKCKKTKKKQG